MIATAEQVKVCRKCGQTKPLDQFYRESGTRDGWRNVCKACWNGPRRPRKPAMPSAERRARQRRRLRAYKAAHPVEAAASYAVARAIAKGILVSRPCEVCGKRPTHGHHEDYTKPLLVRWLCPLHHKWVHRDRLCLLPLPEREAWVRANVDVLAGMNHEPELQETLVDPAQLPNPAALTLARRENEQAVAEREVAVAALVDGADLSYREREIIKLRYGLGGGYAYTLEETARIFKVTRERVRQVEIKAIHKLRKAISED